MSILSVEGNIVNTDLVRPGRVEIDTTTGLITQVGRATGDADITFKDEFIFPGFVDLHVHAREDASGAQNYKEDFLTAGQAAINGGVVAFADMPNNPEPPIDENSYEEKYELTGRCPVDVLLYAGVGPHTGPLRRQVPYKVYLGQSVGDLFFSSAEYLDHTLASYEGQNVSFHCEDPAVLAKAKTQATHELQRPVEAEVKAVQQVLELIRKHGLYGKICHVSTAEALKLIAEAKAHGVPVTAEVAPHHLCFDQSDLDGPSRKLLQVNPPIRETTQNCLALIEGLRTGSIDFLATDHAPHLLEEKQRGISGMPHLDTYGPFAAWLMREQKFTSQDIARVCSFNPGKFFAQFSTSHYGRIEPGYMGSLAVLDMKRPITITKEMLKTKCGWSPFEGMELPGRVVMTIVRGKAYKIEV